MLDVMFYEAFDEEEKLLRKFLPKHINADFTPDTIQEYRFPQLTSSLISIRTQSIIPVAWAKDLKGILTRSTGYDHLLTFRKRTKSKIPCGYLPEYCSRAVAEQAMMMVMALLRKLKFQLAHFNSFNRDRLTGKECQGKNLLVVGVGHIGRELVDIAKGLRMRVKGVDLVRRVKNLEYVPLSQGLVWADIIICALSLTKKTNRMLGYTALKKVKRGTIFVNIARGEISPTKDLRRLLDENRLGGVGLDVYDEEATLAEHLRDKKRRKTSAIKTIWELKDRPSV